jgi:diguanylate cyclase (GGDEF)-like protein
MRVAFVCSTGAVATVAAEAATARWHATSSQWLQFGLVAAASVGTVFLARRSPAAAPAAVTIFLVAAAIALPVGFAPFVALPACALAALWQRTPPFVLAHRTITASLATVTASAIAHAQPDAAGASRAGLSVVAAVAFCAVSRTLDGAFDRLSRSRRFRAPLVDGLTSDLVLAFLGAAIAAVWASDPWRAPLALAPLVLFHRLQRLPTLEQQALTDAKTGLMNMHVFDDALDAALARAQAERRPLSLVVVDLDLLREINNAHGHLVGDAVIKGISDVLRQQIRRGDLAARFGGEEFMLALPDTPPDRAIRIAERIREAVASRVFSAEPGGPATRATLSAGVAAYPYDARTRQALIHAADLAVMAAKARGRNRVVDASEIAVRSAAAGRARR